MSLIVRSKVIQEQPDAWMFSVIFNDECDKLLLCFSAHTLTIVVDLMSPRRYPPLWWFGTLICWHQMKQTQWGEKKGESDRGSDWGGKKKDFVNVCMCVWKLRLRLQTWGASKCLDAFAYERRQEGVFGRARSSSLASLIPRPSHPFRACLRSDSLALSVWTSQLRQQDLICYVFPPLLSLPPPQLSLSLSGTLAPCFKEPAKGTFQTRVMSLDKGKVGMKKLWDSR